MACSKSLEKKPNFWLQNNYKLGFAFSFHPEISNFVALQFNSNKAFSENFSNLKDWAKRARKLCFYA
jgi:hypothetical protein